MLQATGLFAQKLQKLVQKSKNGNFLKQILITRKIQVKAHPKIFLPSYGKQCELN